MDQRTISILIPVVILLVIVAYRAIQQRQSGKAWEQVAEKLGLTYQKAGSESKFSGKYRGRDVRAEIVRRSSTGDARRTHAVTLVEAGHMGEQLQETFVVYNPKSYSEKDKEQIRKYLKDAIFTGDAELDRYYSVRTADAERAKKLLAGSKFRQAIQNMAAGLGGDAIGVTIEGKVVNYEMGGRQIDEGKMVKTLDSLCDIAEAVESGK